MHRTATKIGSTATIKKPRIYMSSEFLLLKKETKKKGLVS